MTRRPDEQLAAEVFTGAPGWAVVDCSKCKKPFRWPAGLASRLANSNNAQLRRAVAAPMCDGCDGSTDAYVVPEAKPLTPEAVGIPEGYPNHEPDRAVLNWLRSDQRTLLVIGPTDSGKTCQLKAAVRWWIENHGRSVLYRSEPQLMRGLREFDFGRAGKLLERACTVGLLVVDDVGTHHVGTDRATGEASGWTYTQWIEILEARFRSHRTIVATNLDGEKFRALPYIDSRVMKRLLEGGQVLRMEKR